VNASQLATRLESELITQQHAHAFVRHKRVGLPTASIEREHEVAPKSLAVGMLANERLELADELNVLAGLELGRDVTLQRAREFLPQTRRLHGQSGVGAYTAERLTAPERDRGGESVACVIRLSSPQRLLAFAHESAELQEVDGLARDLQHVPVGVGANDVGAESAPDVRHVGLQRLARTRRRKLTPHRVDEHIG
jgi:hypothetical protein